MMIISTSW